MERVVEAVERIGMTCDLTSRKRGDIGSDKEARGVVM